MVDLVNTAPVTVDPETDYVLVHRRPADFDPLDPLKHGSIQLVPVSALGGGSETPGDSVDGGGPDDGSGTTWDGGTP